MTIDVLSLSDCHVRIWMLAEYADKQAFSHFVHVPSSLLKDMESMRCTLVYPLNESHTFQIKLEKFGFGEDTLLDVDAILLAIAKEYKKLWNEHNDWFWGHDWSDLWIERLTFNGNNIEVGVGS